MKANFTDKFRKDYRVYLEPILATASGHIATKMKCRTMSKYIRFAVIRALIEDGYPLNKVSRKFDKFYNWFNNKNLNKGVTIYR